MKPIWNKLKIGLTRLVTSKPLVPSPDQYQSKISRINLGVWSDGFHECNVKPMIAWTRSDYSMAKWLIQLIS